VKITKFDKLYKKGTNFESENYQEFHMGTWVDPNLLLLPQFSSDSIETEAWFCSNPKKQAM
jgi:hypothetical protein